MSKTAKIIFTLSLILNALFLGLFSGQLYHVKHEPRPWDEMKAALAPETLTLMKATFKEKGKDVFPLFREADQKKKAMRDVIVAPEFDPQAFDALAVDLSGLNNRLMDHRLVTIKSILSRLPQAEREKMADHTVERLLGAPREGKRAMMRARNAQANNKDGMGAAAGMMNGDMPPAKPGAIEAAPGDVPFDARVPMENHMQEPVEE